MRKMIQKIVFYLTRTNEYTKEQQEQIEYALRITLFESSKIIGTFIIFSLMGYPLQAIIAITAMSLSKPFIGGYHENTQIKCFITSLLTFGTIIYLSVNLQVPFTAKLILLSWCLFCIYQQSPVIHPKMQITKNELLRRNRVIGTSISVLLIILSLLTYKSPLVSDTVFWTLLFQALLLFNKR